MRWHLAVPASIANLGPGFDILALAIDLENEVTVTSRADDSVLVDTEDGPGAAFAGQDNLMARAYRSASSRLGADHPSVPGVHLICRNRIPMGSGLGSSAAAIISGVVAAHLINQAQPTGQAIDVADLLDGGLNNAAILDCATEIEGHPDNVAAALLGGLVICSPGAAVQRVDVTEDLRCVVFVPAEQSRTPESRAAVPASFSREDAVFNAGRTALLVHALGTNNLESLAEAMQDRWHQPYRSRFFPALNPVMAAAEGAGAYGACLAGAGPSIVALCAREQEERIGRAMKTAAEACGVAGSILMTGVRNRGAVARRID